MTSIGYVPQYPIPSFQILDNTYELHEGILSLDFDPLTCNCSSRTLANNIYPYNYVCYHSLVVYQTICKTTNRVISSRCTKMKENNNPTLKRRKGPGKEMIDSFGG